MDLSAPSVNIVNKGVSVAEDGGGKDHNRSGVPVSHWHHVFRWGAPPSQQYGVPRFPWPKRSRTIKSSIQRAIRLARRNQNRERGSNDRCGPGLCECRHGREDEGRNHSRSSTWPMRWERVIAKLRGSHVVINEKHRSVNLVRNQHPINRSKGIR